MAYPIPFLAPSYSLLKSSLSKLLPPGYIHVNFSNRRHIVIMLITPSSGDWAKPRTGEDYVQPVKYSVEDTTADDEGISCTVTVKDANIAHLADYKHRLSQLDTTALESVRRELLSVPQESRETGESWCAEIEGHLEGLLNGPCTVISGDMSEKYKKHEMCNLSWFHNTPTERSIQYTFKLSDTDRAREQKNASLISALTDETGKVGVFTGIAPCYQPSYADATARVPVYRLYGIYEADLQSTEGGLKSWLCRRGWVVEEPTFRPGPKAKISQISADDEWAKDIGEYFETQGIPTCSVESPQLASLGEVPGLVSITSLLPPTPRDGQAKVVTAHDPPSLTQDGVVVFRDVTDV